jgi:tetratricopeptide (TPR) repeat protein
MRAQLPSDFPAALGALDESDLPVISAGLPAKRGAPPPVPKAPAAKPPATGTLDIDLPAVAAGLPAAKPGAPKGPSRAAASFDLDLPTPAAELPAVKRSGDLIDLPVIAADLPVPAAGLPAVAADLPSPAASLPVPAAGLPVARGFGEIDLPTVAETLPSVAETLPTHAESLPANPPPGQYLPARSGASPSPPGSFGEIELPREASVVTPSLTGARPPSPDSADFGDLQFEDKPRAGRTGTSVMVRADAVQGGGGMSFGEVDFGGGDSGAPPVEAAIGVEASNRAMSQPPGGPATRAAATAAMSTSVHPAKPRERPAPVPRRRSIGKMVAAGVVVAAILGGAALQLTSYGAFGYLAIGDTVHAADYDRAVSAAMTDTEKALGVDTYDAAKAAADVVAAAHGRTPRAKPLTAYAALVDFATTARFGADTTRAARGKQLLADLPPNQPVKYLDVALAAQAAANDEPDKARKALDAASKHDPGDRIQVEVALLRGDVEAGAKDWAAALVAFKHALDLSNDARAHFGLARAYDALGDAMNAKKELEATLAASPQHPGALTLRARMKSGPVDDAQALKDLATVLDGPARAKASPNELSSAYAAKAWVSLERGAASDARDSFGQAVKLNPRNVEALNGEGRLLLNEGRYTEALSRFDTALQLDPTSPDTIANDAEAKLALERLADAKQQLLEAKQRFPKSLPILLLLGKVEQHLGNNDAAEADLRTAVSYVDPARHDAVLPFVALSELLSARGRLADAKATLDDAKKKLPASAALDRAFGEVSELQGEYDTAIAYYRSAITKDPKDVATHFRLAVVLRRIRKFDDAGAELDRVAAVDKDYPGLSLERGLLFEESGDVEKAIEQFKGALAKAPDDPDLQLRVGSAYVAIGRPDDALPMLRKVLEKRPTSAEAHHYIGRALMLRGRADQVDALRYLRRAVDLDPNRAEFHVYLAWAANDAQPAQLELARDEIDKALALDKLNAEAYWQKGVLERMEGAIDDAVKDEKRALELRPSRYEAHATLAECYEDKNDEGTAMAEWTKAIAGDGNATSADGSIPHPYWRYKYGKLLLERAGAGAALVQLLPAATSAEKMDQRPGWLAPLEFLVAEALRKSGRRADAAEHYRRFLDIAPVNSPDRADAQAALTQLTGGR